MAYAVWHMGHSHILRSRECLGGTYPPRERGITTFTPDLRLAIYGLRAESQPAVIAAPNTPADVAAGYLYPLDVVFEIGQQRLSDYRLAAEYVNLSGVETLNVRHEFEIFGGV